MMNSTHILTEGALETLMNGGTLPEVVVQILGMKKMPPSNGHNERFRLLLSDGKFKINVAIYAAPSSESLELYSVVKLQRYMSNVIKNKDRRDTRILLVLELDVLARGETVGKVLGDPVSLGEIETTNSQRSDISTLNGKIVTLHRVRRERTSSLRESRVISPISSLNPFYNNWVIKARVMTKSSVRTWSNSNGEGKLFTVDFGDKGGQIRCTAFRECVDLFYDRLEVDKVYYVGKCVLQPINRQFCNLKHEFEMTMTNYTIIEESVADNEVIPYMEFNFTTIDKIGAMVAETVVDVIGVCKTVSELQTFISKSTNRELKKREILLVDQSKSGIHLVLWNNTAESFVCDNNPVVCVKNAKIREFLGTKNLNLSVASQIKINPPDIAQTFNLRTWFDREGHQLDIKNISRRGGTGVEVPWMSFRQAQLRGLSQDDSFVFQTFATILLVRLDRAVYKSCPSGVCQKKVTDLENGMYRCEKCNREYDVFEYRFLLSMNASDASSSQWLTVFSREAEKILGKTANEVGVALERDQENLAKVFDDVQFQQYVFKCRAKVENYNDEQKLKIVLFGVESVNFEKYNTYLLQKMEAMR